jgi:hypothetical protein
MTPSPFNTNVAEFRVMQHGLIRNRFYQYKPPFSESVVFGFVNGRAHGKGGVAYMNSGSMETYTSRDVGAVTAGLREHFSLVGGVGSAAAVTEGQALGGGCLGSVSSMVSDPSLPTASPDASQRIVVYAATPDDGVAGVAAHFEVSPHARGERAEIRSIRVGVLADGMDSGDEVRSRTEEMLEWINNRTGTPVDDQLFEQEALPGQRVTPAEGLPEVAVSPDPIHSIRPLPDGFDGCLLLVDNPFESDSDELAAPLPDVGRTDAEELAGHLMAQPILPVVVTTPVPEDNRKQWVGARSWTVSGLTLLALPFGRTYKPPVISIEVSPA